MADATLTAAELQRALHIDSPDELENAQSLQAAAEIYLENAGVERDYSNALYKQVVVNYIESVRNQRLHAERFHPPAAPEPAGESGGGCEC